MSSAVLSLSVVTPLEVVVTRDDVVSLTAEDESGRFGILPRHADFLTALDISVLSYACTDGTRHHVALREGVLTVTGGTTVRVSTRDAVPGDDLATLSHEVLERFRQQDDAERTEHVDTTRLHLQAIRQIVRGMQGGGGISL